MGRQSSNSPFPASTPGTGTSSPVRRKIGVNVLQILAVLAAAGMVLVVTVAPQQLPALAAPAPLSQANLQHIQVVGEFPTAATRDSYTVTRRIIVVAPPRPAAASVPAGEAQLIAYGMVQARGWGDDQFSCLVALWNRESHWSTTAGNQSSGAYGIPQALPGSKMASAGPNWQTDAATQITWGLGYITGRYKTPCNAWAHSQSTGWY